MVRVYRTFQGSSPRAVIPNRIDHRQINPSVLVINGRFHVIGTAIVGTVGRVQEFLLNLGGNTDIRYIRPKQSSLLGAF